jgi:biotin synthase
VNTLRAVRDAGMELCSGGIIGMGEQDEDVVRMAFALRDLNVESIPVNFLNPIDGTPLAGTRNLNPRYCLKVLSMFRFANPQSELRIAGGRELHLGSMQALGLYPANSIFVGDYLTTKGQAPSADYRMIEELGFEVVLDPE